MCAPGNPAPSLGAILPRRTLGPYRRPFTDSRERTRVTATAPKRGRRGELPAVAFASGQAGRVSLTPVAWGSLLFQGVVVSFASYLTWFWLLRRYLATRLSVFSFMTPIFGVTFGVLILGDPLSPSFAGGAALELSGITIVSGAGLLRPRAG